MGHTEHISTFLTGVLAGKLESNDKLGVGEFKNWLGENGNGFIGVIFESRNFSSMPLEISFDFIDVYEQITILKLNSKFGALKLIAMSNFFNIKHKSR